MNYNIIILDFGEIFEWGFMFRVVDACFERQIPEITPPCNFLDEDVSNCSAVVSSLPMTINWLRDYAKQNPSLRIQVAITIFPYKLSFHTAHI